MKHTDCSVRFPPSYSLCIIEPQSVEMREWGGTLGGRQIGIMKCGQKALEAFSFGAKLMNEQRRF